MSAEADGLVREHLALSPGLEAALHAEGFAMRAVLVVRFLDTNESARWFLRHHETVGYVLHPFDGTAPMDPAILHADARAEWGDAVDLIY